jgi:hypothetical protein
MMSPWDKLLERPACEHLVQVYQPGDESALISNVGMYFSEGLHREQSAIAITTAEHRVVFLRELENRGIDTRAALREKQLVWLDAQETLSRFLMSGGPDWNRFELVIGHAVRSLKRAEENVSFRAYGEMVDLLWRSRQFAAALRLEHFWNKLLSRFSFSLYCAYCLEEADEKQASGMLDNVLTAHTHTIPNVVARQHQAPSAQLNAI